MLAQRTQKLIESVKPDAVMVQTNEQWWKAASMMGYVDSQQEMDTYGKDLAKYTGMKSYNIWNPTRSLLFKFRLGLFSTLW